MNKESCRLHVQQPGFLKYRVPFFKELSAREGIRLKLFFGYLGKELNEVDIEGIDAVAMPAKSCGIGPFRFRWQPAQWANAKEDACDVLVLSWNVKYLSLLPALRRARKHGIKTILWGHGFSKREAPLRKMLRDAVGRRADALLFYDYHTAKQFIEAGWPKDKIYVAPNALDQTEIQAARSYWLEHKQELDAFRADKGLDNKSNLIYIGRLYTENNLDVLIEALAIVRRKCQNVQLLVIGGESKEMHRLKLLAEQKGVSDLIRWLGAIYDEKEIAPYMLSSGLFCYPANIGLSIMHAMGYGLPVVTGDNLDSHNPEVHVMKDGVSGRMFEHLNAQALASVLIELLSNPDKAASLGTAAREAVFEKYTTRKMADGFLEAVRGVVGDSQ
jgi:glycosyltransferase involved in cell wall biosynthesis